MKKQFFLTALICPLLIYNITGQTKFEREFRMRTDDVPLIAQQFIDSAGFTGRIKWFGEESQTEKSIEAKTKFNGTRYSIEFDTLGNLQDVEIEIEFDKIPEPVRNNISSYFSSVFDNYKIIKSQVQYSGDKNIILQFLRDKTIGSKIVTRYEIVVNSQKGKARNRYEFTFTDTGDFKNRSIIIIRNFDNLEH